MAEERTLMATFKASISEAEAAFKSMEKRLDAIEKVSDKASNSIGQKLTRGFEKADKAGQRFRNTGKEMTKMITAPALGATAAVAGLTAKLGFDRLVGMDSAKAKLEGLGYSAEKVGDITGQVTKAIEGGMTTMAEGTDIAAGALAAGVKEGKELQHYIKMVGDAAVGANRPVGEMAQIFNRVQGMGKLMTQELNMIEDGMPGFAQAMSKHLGVSQEEFRKMVTDGKVSSKEFLTVMDDFAGGMAEAYANSWQGMVKNTKAYIGIIGEQLLGGVFEESKSSLKEFIDYLKSEEVMDWADRTGKQLGAFFSSFLNKIKSLIGWFTNLESSQQKLIGAIMGFTIAAGPILLTVGTLLVKFASLGSALLGMATSVSKAGGLIAFLGQKLSFLSSFLSILTGPVGWITLALVALGTIFYKLYQNVDWFRDGINGLIDVVLTFTSGALKEMIKGLKNLKDWAFAVGDAIRDKIIKDYKALDDDDLLKVATNKFKDFMKVLGTASQKASDSTKVLGKGVSKETKKALDKYVKYSEESSRILERVKLNHGDISDKKAKELLEIEKKLSDDLTKQYENRKEDEIKNTKKVLEFTESFTDKEKEKILQKTIHRNNKEIKEQNKLNEAIYNLKRKQVENGKLTPYELKELQDLEDKRNKVTTSSLTKTEEEQQKILSRMKQNSESYSVDEASKAIKRAEKARKARLKEIEQEYEDRVYLIEQEESFTKEQREKALLEAKSQKEEKLRMANTSKDKLVDIVKQQNKDIEEEMDLSNGRVYSNSEKWWNKYSQGVKDRFNRDISNTRKFFTDTDWQGIINTSLENVGSWIAAPFKGASKSIGEAVDSWKENINKAGEDIKYGYKNVTGWFSQQGQEFVNAIKEGWHIALENGFNLWSSITTKLGEKWESTKGWFSERGRNIQHSFKNGWNDAWNQAGNIWSKVSNKVLDTWQNVINSTRDKLDEAKETATDKSWRVYKGTSKWFGESYNIAKDKVTGIFNRTRERFSETAKTAADKSYSVLKSTSKWFGKAYNSVDSLTGGMLSRASSNFQILADEGWKKAKSVYNGFTTWLGRTLKWIRNIGKDFGSAAGDLGKTVANKAIDGLNGMIGGVNKIAKAITGNKQLITPITPLSTGTFDGSHLPTDSNGGLKQSTIAMVNDKGPGNAPGGGVQEIIHRADGTLEMPKGQNRIVHLGIGDSVINARDTRRMKQAGFLTENIPKFSRGTKDWMERLGLDNLKDKTSNAVQTVKEHGGKGASWLGDKIGDIWDYMSNPGKLVESVMSGMNINFGSGNNATVKLAKAAYKSLTKSLVKKVKSWFDNMGGNIVGGILDPDNISYHFGHTAAYTAATGRYWHEGVDFPFIYEPIRTPMGGKLKRMPFMGGGYGNWVKVMSGAIEMIFAHLKNFSMTPPSGTSVKPGEVVGLSGNTGFSTGPHLHFGIRRNGKDINPEPWLRKAKAKGSIMIGGKGGNAKVWKPQVIKALKLARLPTSSAYINAWIKQIDTESSGNARAIGGTDGYNDGHAQGLVQVKPGTFNSFKLPGYGNIFNGLDNLIAGMRYAKRRYGGRLLNVIGQGHGYANGDIISSPELAWIAEGGFSESIISHDPAYRARSKVLHDRTGELLGFNEEPELLKEIIKLMIENNQFLSVNNNTIRKLVDKDGNVYLDGKLIGKIFAQELGRLSAFNNYERGG